MIQTLDVLALTSRLVPSTAKPLSAGEFWPLLRRGLGEAVELQPQEIAAALDVPQVEAERLSQLIGRRTALALAIEQLDLRGIWTVTADDDDFPVRLRDRLGDAAPAVLHGVGDRELLGIDGLAIVGSRNVTPEGAEVAREAARVAASHGLPVVSGAARGVDQLAMSAAYEAGGYVVGVVADALDKAVGRPETRRAVASGVVCLVTPVAPSVGFSPATAMARNKIIYGLAKAALVVASDHESGGTWAGATEALRKKWTPVLSWQGEGGGTGNRPLVSWGAQALEGMEELRAELDQIDKQMDLRGGSFPERKHADQLALDA